MLSFNMNKVMSASRLVETVLINFEDFSESFLTCGTCLCVYDGAEHTPKLLPCSHTVCRTCLERILETGTLNESFRCPICREGIAVPRGGAAAFPPSFLVNQLLDLMASQRRDIVPKCGRHPAQELLFCETCDSVFCASCVDGNHSGRGALSHNVISFSVAIKRMSEILLYKTHLCVQQLAAAYDLVSDEMNRLDDNTSKCEQIINSSFEELVSLVEARRKSLLSVLRKVREEKHRVLKEQLDLIAAEKSKVQVDCDGLQYQMDVRSITKRISDLNNKLDVFATLAEPRENAFIRYNHKQQNGAATAIHDIDNLLKEFGRIKISTTYPALCVASSLQPSTVHLRSELHVRTVDYHGKPRLSGGDPVTAELRNENNELLPTNVNDSNDGSYVIDFTPTQAGQHRLNVCIFDRPIRDSPFVFQVAGQQKSSAVSGGTRGSACGQFAQPFAVVSSKNRFENRVLYVLDTGNSRIVELNEELQWQRELGVAVAVEQGATGMALTFGDVNVRLWVVNWRLRAVLEFDPQQDKVLNTIRLPEFVEPTSVAAGAGDTIYVADNGAGCVFVVDVGSGKLRSRVGQKWHRITGLLIDERSQQLVVLEHTKLHLIKLSNGKELSNSPLILSSLPSDNGCAKRLGQAGGLALDPEGRLLVSRASGVIQVLASPSGPHLFDVEPTKEEQLKRPAGLTVISNGFLVVADQGNNCVKKFRYS